MSQSPLSYVITITDNIETTTIYNKVYEKIIRFAMHIVGMAHGSRPDRQRHHHHCQPAAHRGHHPQGRDPRDCLRLHRQPAPEDPRDRLHQPAGGRARLCHLAIPPLDLYQGHRPGAHTPHSVVCLHIDRQQDRFRRQQFIRTPHPWLRLFRGGRHHL